MRKLPTFWDYALHGLLATVLFSVAHYCLTLDTYNAHAFDVGIIMFAGATLCASHLILTLIENWGQHQRQRQRKNRRARRKLRSRL